MDGKGSCGFLICYAALLGEGKLQGDKRWSGVGYTGTVYPANSIKTG